MFINLKSKMVSTDVFKYIPNVTIKDTQPIFVNQLQICKKKDGDSLLNQ